MWKTRIKISKILTNIHAGFVTALLGCVLTFGATPAMGSATVTTSYCTVTGTEGSGKYTEPCSGATQIGMSTAAMCNTAQVEHTCLRHTNGQTYYITACSCHSGTSGTSQTLYNTACGTITIAYPTCSSGSGDTTNCTPTTVTATLGQTYTPVNTVRNCKLISYQRVNGNIYASCTSCNGSMSMQTDTIEVPGCDDYEFSTCPCTQSYQCPTPTPSTTMVGGIRRTFVRSCNTVTGACGSELSTCFCAEDYYGTVSKSGQTCSGTCTKCATDPKTGVAGVTDSYGNGTASERCYIPSGEPFTDEKGSGTYSGACYY